MLPTVEQIKTQLIPRLLWYINKKIAEAGGSSDDFVTAEDIQRILNGTYEPVADDDSITPAEIQSILNGEFSPVEDSDTWSANDFIF